MSKVLEIKASYWQREDLPGYHVRYTLPDDAIVTSDVKGMAIFADGTVTTGTPSAVTGGANVGASNVQAPNTNAAAGALLGGGSGGYGGGGVGGERPETAQTMQVVDIAFVPGGITHIPYPTGSSKRSRLTGVVAGLGALAFTPEAGKHPGIGRFSIVGAEIDSCPLDDSAIGSEAGVFVGPSILAPYGQSNHFSETFQVGADKGPGYGPVLPIDRTTYVNVRFGTGVPSDLYVEVQAHDR